MNVEGLCNLCVPRLCNTYVERLAIIPCVVGPWVGLCSGSDPGPLCQLAQVGPQFAVLLNGGCRQGGFGSPILFSCS